VDKAESSIGEVDAGEFRCELAMRPVEDLRKHPSYVRLGLSVPADQLSNFVEQGDLAFSQPIVITRNGIIIDGYARYQLALKEGRRTIPCLEYDLDEQEALRWLIRCHTPSRGLNGFSRALLALDLEHPFQEAARANQQRGGRAKDSSKLTEVQAVDVRAKLAIIASVSAGNLTKAKQVMKSSVPAIQLAVKANEISLHNAWQWSRLPNAEQLNKLEELRSCKGVTLMSRRLIQKRIKKALQSRVIPPRLSDFLGPFLGCDFAKLNPITVCEIDAPGEFAYLTTKAWQRLAKGAPG
jgi:hypothetical protein